MKVLIIEDEARLMRGVVRDVQSFGYEVVNTASSLQEALALIDTMEEVDIAIVDIGLGNDLLGGIEVAKRLQAVFENLAIIFLTIHHKDPIQEKAIKEVVMANYLLKPYIPYQLELALRLAMNLKQNIPRFAPQTTTLIGINRGRQEAIKTHLIKWIKVNNERIQAFISEDKFYEVENYTSLEKLVHDYAVVFTKIQQSYAVNLTHVYQIEGDTKSERKCYINHKKVPLPISRRLFASVKQKWLESHQK